MLQFDLINVRPRPLRKVTFGGRHVCKSVGFVFTLICIVGLAQAQDLQKERADDKKSPSEAGLSLASILASTPNSREYKGRQQCISRIAIRDQEVLNKRLIVFTLRGRDRPKYLVQFGRSCFGLNKNATVSIESRGSSRLCAGDYVRTETFEFGRRSWGPRCTIPRFQQITDYQLDLLKDALLTGRIE